VVCFYVSIDPLPRHVLIQCHLVGRHAEQASIEEPTQDGLEGGMEEGQGGRGGVEDNVAGGVVEAVAGGREGGREVGRFRKWIWRGEKKTLM